MTEPHQSEPDEDLLDFLGGIDEGNDDSKEGDFSDFLANGGLEKTEVGRAPDKSRAPAPQESAKEGKRE
jgi:hypothetical protein